MVYNIVKKGKDNSAVVVVETINLEMVGMSMRQVKSEYWKNIRDMMLVEKYQRL